MRPDPPPHDALEDARARVEREVVEESFRAYAAGARRVVQFVPVVLAGISFPYIALTSWGRRWLTLPVAVYFVTCGLFVAAAVYAMVCFRRHDALSRRALWAERLETWAALALEASIVLGPPHVLHWGWLVYLVHISALVPIRRVQPDTFPSLLTSLGAVCLAFLVRDGWSSFGIALFLSFACLFPIHILIAMDERSFRLEVDRKLAVEALANAEVELERSRIARTLHDGVSGRMNALLWRVRALKVALPEGQGTEIEQRLRECLAELRGAVWNVEGAARSRRELAQRVRDLLAGMAEPRLACEIADVAGDVDVPSNVASCLYSAVAELTHNALLHAEASAVGVRLTEALELVVWDDGSGMPAERRPGGGLVRLEEAIRRAGGTLESRPRTPRGTEVRVTFPAQKRPA